jgi:hypothetical protein
MTQSRSVKTSCVSAFFFHHVVLEIVVHASLAPRLREDRDEIEAAHSRDLRGCRHLRRTISVDGSRGLGAVPPAGAGSKEDYVAPQDAIGQGLDRVRDYVCDLRSDPLPCNVLGLLRPDDRWRADAGRDAVSDTARGSNDESSRLPM